MGGEIALGSESMDSAMPQKEMTRKFMGSERVSKVPGLQGIVFVLKFGPKKGIGENWERFWDLGSR